MAHLLRTVLGYLFIILLSCKPSGQEFNSTSPSKSDSSSQKMQAVVLFSFGEALAGDKKVKVGDVLLEKTVIRVAKKSHLDLQLIYLDSDAVVRLMENSEFTFSQEIFPEKQVNRFFLKMGKALFRFFKLKKETDLEVSTPSFHAGVRGTKFATAVTKEGNSSIELYEGSVAVKPSIPDLEKLPPEVIEKIEIFKKAGLHLAASEIVLDAGTKSENLKQVQEKFNLDMGFKELFQKPELSSLLSLKRNPSLEELEKAQAVVSAFYQDKKKKETADAALAAKSSFKLEKISEAELQQKIKEYDELMALEKSKLENASDKSLAVKEFNATRKKELLKKIENILGKESETVFLKDGRKFQGVVEYDEKENVIVFTPDGRFEFKKEEIEGIEGN